MGEWSAYAPPVLLSVPTTQKVGWAPGPVWTVQLRGESLATVGSQAILSPHQKSFPRLAWIAAQLRLPRAVSGYSCINPFFKVERTEVPSSLRPTQSTNIRILHHGRSLANSLLFVLRASHIAAPFSELYRFLLNFEQALKNTKQTHFRTRVI